MISVKEEIKAIEEVLGESFGEGPRAFRNTLLNRVFARAVYTRNFSFWKDFYRDSEESFFNRNFACIFIGNSENKSAENYSKLHELMHLYTYKGKMELFEMEDKGFDMIKKAREAILSRLFSLREPSSKIEIDRQTLEQCVIARALNEGLADYIAIEAQRRQAVKGKPFSCFFIKREKKYTGFQGKVGNPLNPLPLSPFVAENTKQIILLSTDKIVKNFSEAIDISFSDITEDFISSFLYHLDLFSHLRSHTVYYSGYYYVKSALQGRTRNLTKPIEEIRLNIPKSYEEYFANLERNLKSLDTQR